MIKTIIERSVLLAIALVFSVNVTNAQVSQDSDLYQILNTKDSLMFEIGFNQCDMAQLDQLLPEKFEFYHDKDGITTSKTAFIKALKDNLCSSGKNRYQRVLVEESMKVFPLYDHDELYGAIQKGVHYFGGNVARFTHLWLIEEGKWMPARMISYDHKRREVPVITDITFVELSVEALSFYLGKYEFSPDFVLSIVKEGGKIYGDAQGQKVEIKPYGNHLFLDESQTMKLSFVIGSDGRVAGLEMTGPEGEMVAKKIN
jgi:hypothetical protein